MFVDPSSATAVSAPDFEATSTPSPRVVSSAVLPRPPAADASQYQTSDGRDITYASLPKVQGRNGSNGSFDHIDSSRSSNSTSGTESCDDNEEEDDISREQRIRHIARSFLVLLALVMYFHGMYAIFAVLARGAALKTAIAMTFFSAAILTWEDTFADIMAIDIYSDIIEFDSGDKGFLCGLMDAHLHKCCGVSCSVSICFNRRLYISRLLYYNFNAVLISISWLGVDVMLSSIIDALTSWQIGERIGMDLLFLFIANIILISQHQMVAQFGVIGDQAVLYVVDKPVPVMEEGSRIINHPMLTPTRLSESRKHIVNSHHEEPDARSERSHRGHSNTHPPELRHMAVMSGHTLHRPLIVDATDPPEAVGDSRSNSVAYLVTYWMVRIDKALRVLVCFFALCMYWCAIWDLVGSIPSAEILKSHSEELDDESFTDDFYERRNPGTTDAEFKMLLLGVSYVLGSAIYLLLTGEIFTITRTQTSDAKKIQRHISRRFGRMRAAVTSTPRTTLRFGKYAFVPMRLLDLNMKGFFGVVMWVGLAMILSSIERNVVYEISYSDGSRIATQLVWILISNLILITNESFGLSYGGRPTLSRQHEVVSIDYGDPVAAGR